ncbi:hypothetical protein C8R46DRAFT_1038911 [Mycena filopes]|nr:hypothetical protein C8R46DRAFT_1038911 [Mycena filopes]
MQFLASLLLAAMAASTALATVPTISSFSAAGCSGAPLATWSGVPEDAYCQATPGANSLNITPGASDNNCRLSVYTTPACSLANCDGTTGGVIADPPDVAGCFTSPEQIGSVRILCITTG